MMKYYLSLLIFIFACKITFSQGRYYKAQMHCHSTNSDGKYTPTDLAKKYKQAGYEIIFITDHNVLTDSSEYNIPGILAIPSEEITFKRHMNGFFLSNLILPDSDYTCQDAIDAVRAMNGLIQLNHYCKGPFTDDNWEVSAVEIIAMQDGPDFLEIWNTGTESVQTHDDKTIWDSVLTAGKIVWGSATDDFHPSVILNEGNEFNKGWNMIWLDTLTPTAVFQALKNGNFYASTGVEITNYSVIDNGGSKTISITSSNADKITFWGPGHQKIQEIQGNSATFILQNHDYVRIELVKTGIFGMGNKYAWTQPVFLNITTDMSQNNLSKTKKSNLYIFPNPSEGLVNIVSNDDITNIYVRDLAGKVVFYTENTYLNLNKLLLNLSYLEEGMYIIQVNTNNDCISKKLLIKK